MKELHLVGDFRKEGPVRDFIRILGVFPFLPAEDIPFLWAALGQSLPVELQDGFREYYFDTWIGGNGRAARYSPELWSCYESVLLKILSTTNIAEAWNNSFALHLHSHPTIWSFCEQVIEEQSLTDRKVDAFYLKHEPEVRRAKWINKTDKNLEKWLERTGNMRTSWIISVR